MTITTCAGWPAVQKGADVEFHGKPLRGRPEQIKGTVAVRLKPVTHRQNTRHRVNEAPEIIIAQRRIKRWGHRRLQLCRHGGKVRGEVRLRTVRKPVQTLKQGPLCDARHRSRMKGGAIKARHTGSKLIRQIT